MKNEGKFNLDDTNRCIYFWENKILDSTKSNLMGCIGCHSSEIRGLCLMKKPCKALQHFPYFIKKFHFLEENFLKERKKKDRKLTILFYRAVAPEWSSAFDVLQISNFSLKNFSTVKHSSIKHRIPSRICCLLVFLVLANVLKKDELRQRYFGLLKKLEKHLSSKFQFLQEIQLELFDWNQWL